MPTKAQLESALRNAHNAGDTKAAKKLANALKQGQFDSSPAPQQGLQRPNENVPLLPEQVEQLSPEQQQQYYGTSQPEQQDRSFGERAVGAFETGKTLVTGATSGQVGGLVSAGQQAFDEVRDGEFGSYPAAQRIQGAFQEGQERFTDTPDTEAGQEYLESTSEFLDPLGALPPVVPFVGGTKIFNYNKLTPRQKAIKKELEENPRNPDFAKFELVEGSPKKTARLKQAVRQYGGGEQGRGTIAVISSASPADKKATREMVEIIQKGRKDPLFRDSNRVGDVVGKNLRNRVLRLKKINTDAGKAIDNVARNQLKGKTVDLTNVRNQFKSAMDDLRVKYDPETGQVDFTGSALEGQGGAATRDLIKRLAPQLRNTEMDAADAHFIKRMIDKDVSWGKTPGGIAGDIDSSVKGLRTGINESIRDISDPYRKANVKYKESLDAIESLQKSAGGTVDLESPEALGVSIRRLTNNTQSRAKLLDSLDQIDSVLSKNGIKFKDDIKTQANIATALENRFKTQGKTSIEGIGQRVAQEATKSNLQRGAEMLGTAADKTVGRSDEKALEALLEITK